MLRIFAFRKKKNGTFNPKNVPLLCIVMPGGITVQT